MAGNGQSWGLRIPTLPPWPSGSAQHWDWGQLILVWKSIRWASHLLYLLKALLLILLMSCQYGLVASIPPCPTICHQTHSSQFQAQNPDSASPKRKLNFTWRGHQKETFSILPSAQEQSGLQWLQFHPGFMSCQYTKQLIQSSLCLPVSFLLRDIGSADSIPHGFHLGRWGGSP